MIVNLASTAIGLALGLSINIGWFWFRGFILGWGDSAPDWYFKIQGYVHTGIVMISVVSCIIFANLFLISKQPGQRK